MNCRRDGWRGSGPNRRSRCSRAPRRSSARARRSSTSRSASRTSTRPAHIRDAAKRALDDGRHALRPVGRAARAARGHRQARGRDARDQRRRRTRSSSRRAPSRSCSSRSWRSSSEGDEVLYPNPGFPIYESVINFVGGAPVGDPAARGDRLQLRHGASSSARVTPRTKLIIINSPQNPTGGVLERRPDRAHRRGRRASATSPCSPTRSTATSSTTASSCRSSRLPGHAGAHDPPRRLLEVVRDDRLAPRLRRDAGAARRARHAADGELRLVHGVVRPARRRRRARGRAGVGRPDGRGVPAPARSRSSTGSTGCPA